MPYKDPTIQKAAQHKHYVDNKPAYMERTKRRRRDQKQKAIEYLGGKCVKCGYNRNWAVLEFHHCSESSRGTAHSSTLYAAGNAPFAFRRATATPAAIAMGRAISPRGPRSGAPIHLRRAPNGVAARSFQNVL